MTIAILLGIVIGAVLGLTGAGGGMLAVPALVAGLGLSMQQAAPISLIAVSLAAAVGAIDGLRKRLLRWRGAVLMASAGAPFTWVGAQLATQLPQAWLQLLFALAMIAAALRMLRQSSPGKAQEHQAHAGQWGQTIFANQAQDANSQAVQVNSSTGRFVWTWRTAFFLSAIGICSGLLTGLLGVGGGFVMVPLLRRYSNVSMHGIVATSLAVIALVGLVGVGGSLARGIHLPLTTTLLFTLGCAGGMLGGRALAKHLSANAVQQSFAWLLLVIALAMVWRAISTI